MSKQATREHGLFEVSDICEWLLVTCDDPLYGTWMRADLYDLNIHGKIADTYHGRMMLVTPTSQWEMY